MRGAVCISERDLLKAFFHGCLHPGDESFFMVCGPGNQVAALKAWAMGYDDSFGMLADDMNSLVVEYNAWRQPAPAGFPSGYFVTRISKWYADNNFSGIFLWDADGDKVLLEENDPRMGLLAPVAVDAEIELSALLQRSNLAWTVGESVLCVSQLDTLGLHFDRFSFCNTTSTLQALASLVPPSLGSQKASSVRQQLHSFLGVLSYASQSLGDPVARSEFARLSRIATQPLTAERVSAANYGPEQQEALRRMQELVLQGSLSHHYLIDPSRPALLTADASGTGYSAMLTQFQPVTTDESVEEVGSVVGEVLRPRVVRFTAGKWNATMAKAKAMKQEAAAIVFGIRKFNRILPQLPVVLVRNDHRNLQWFALSDDPTLQRWWYEVQNHSNIRCVESGFQHIKGIVNPTDAASRSPCMPVDPPGPQLQSLLERPALPLSALRGLGPRLPAMSVIAAMTRAGGRVAGVAERTGQGRVIAGSEPLAPPPPEAVAVAPTEIGPLERYPWVMEAVAAQQDGFPNADTIVLKRDEHVYVHRIGGVSIMFRSGAVVIPSDAALIPLLLERAHSAVTCHASGFSVKQALSHVYWVGMAADSKAFAASCAQCQLAKAPRELPASAYCLRMAMRPFADMEMDCLVFPKRLGEYEGLFIVVDDLLGWGFIDPIKDQKSSTFIAALRNRHLRDFPAPEVMRSDGHKSFKSEEMQALFSEFGIKHRCSAAYNPREHGLVERLVRVFYERLRVIYSGDVPRAVAALERGWRDCPSESRLGLSPRSLTFFATGNPRERMLPDADEAGLEGLIEERAATLDALRRFLLAARIDRQYRRELATGPPPSFDVGDTVMLLRPPQDKMTHGAVAPYLVVAVGDFGVFYSVSLMGPDGEATGPMTRVAANQLRRFDMSRTTPEAAWLRLHQQEFGEESYPTRAVISHRRSRRDSADPADLEFEVQWITAEPSKPTFEPVFFLCSNEHFKEYVQRKGLSARVQQQLGRERARAVRRKLGSDG